MGMTNKSAFRIVAKWFTERGHVIPLDQPAIEFALKVSRISEGNAAVRPFANKADAVSYIRMMAAIIRNASDKPPLSWGAERARQDRRHGYRLLAKQQKAKRKRLALKAKRERELVQDQVRYQERVESDWPIVTRSDDFE